MPRFHLIPALLLAIPLASCTEPEPGPADGGHLPGVDTGRVAVGETAPDFTLPSRTGELVTLSDLYREKNIILVFYRGHW